MQKQILDNDFEEQIFEDELEITAVSFLKMVLEPGSEWASKSGGSDLIVRAFSTDGTKCVLCDDNGVDVYILIKTLLKEYNPPSLNMIYNGRYGVTCGKCNEYFDYQKKSSKFICWACKNGF